MMKGFKIRIYPTKEQETKFWQHIGCCRYVWNYMLNWQEERYKNGVKKVSAFDMIKQLTPLKHDGEHDWLNDVSRSSLATICRDLATAYKRFFDHISKHPLPKKKKSAKSTYPVRNTDMRFQDGRVKIESVGWVKYKTDFNLPQGKGNKFLNPRVIYENGKWMLGFVMECENQAPQLTDKSMGIDLGVKEQAVVAFGDEEIVFHNINKSKRMRELLKQLKHVQRSISRKYEASKKCNGEYIKTNNIIREEEKMRHIYKRMADIRRNYIHQITHELVSLHPCRVVMEDLNVSGILRNKHLARAINEQNFGTFAVIMQYKCAWNGIEFVKANRFYPSSKTCSCCGLIKSDLTLKDRVFKCECGFEIDRDFNAALNLSRYVA